MHPVLNSCKTLDFSLIEKINSESLTMANPAYVIDLAVRQFLYNWHCGLKPTLYFNTKSDGTVFICSKVTSQNFQTLPEEYSGNYCRKSGHSCRRRRNKRRGQSKAQNKSVSEESALTTTESSADMDGFINREDAAMSIMDMNDDMADQQQEDILLPDPVDSYNAQSNSEIDNMPNKFKNHTKTTTSTFLNAEETCDIDGGSPTPNMLID